MNLEMTPEQVISLEKINAEQQQSRFKNLPQEDKDKFYEECAKYFFEQLGVKENLKKVQALMEDGNATMEQKIAITRAKNAYNLIENGQAIDEKDAAQKLAEEEFADTRESYSKTKSKRNR